MSTWTSSTEASMAGTIWSKFFWADWLSDSGLRACSAMARGIWMDMLCVAAAHEPPGYVAVKKRALTTREISRLTGEEISNVEQALGELQSQNVFALTKQGVIYSRRMIRDAKKIEIARKNGKLGGNPSLRKHKRKSGLDNPAPGTRARASTCQSPESRVQKGGSKNEPPLRAHARGSVAAPPLDLNSDWPSNYREQFEAAYPHQVSMRAALAMLDEVHKSGKVSWHDLLAGLATYAKTKPPDRHWMNPKKWLKQERWNDKPASRTNGKHERRHIGDVLADEARRLEGQNRGATVSVGGAELGGEDAQVVPGRKPS